jgi:hypothetical protein
MKQFEIEPIREVLKRESLANLFNVYDEPKLGDNHKTYSVNRTVNFEAIATASPSIVSKYQITLNDAWTSISFKFYGTENLWWIICKTNGIIDPTASPVDGDVINIIKQEFLQTILSEIREN